MPKPNFTGEQTTAPLSVAEIRRAELRELAEQTLAVLALKHLDGNPDL